MDDKAPAHREPAPVGDGRRTLLIICQVYLPDPASVGQHLADTAGAMIRRGWRVVVITSARGYDDPSRIYPAFETLGGVEVVRLPLSSLGKSSIAVRLLAQTIFLLQAVLRAFLVRNVGAVLVTTAPPLGPLAALAVSWIRRVPVFFWVMDLNPDQIVEMGKARPESLFVKAFDLMNRLIIHRSRRVIVLDRFMAERVARKADVSGKLCILPPWPHEDHLSVSHDAVAQFRADAGTSDTFVVMYSGNHSPANPLDTLLEAARLLEDDPRILFLFVGGGQEKRKIEQLIASGAPNIRSLPYQPLERLGASLSSADVHAVTIGNNVVGIVHPCKIYGAMTVGKPVISFGPAECHLADLIRRYDFGSHVPHGDATGAANAIRILAAMTAAEREVVGARGMRAIRAELSQEALCSQFCDALEMR